MAKLTEAQIVLLRQNDVGLLAPKVQVAVQKILAGMRAQGFDPVVFETLRVKKLQEHYLEVGTTQVSWDYTWHKYGVAVDIISKSKQWDAPVKFWKALENLAEANGMKSGADWDANDATKHSFVDLPHIQWGKCRTSPSIRAVQIYAAEGLWGLWDEVGAI